MHEQCGVNQPAWGFNQGMFLGGLAGSGSCMVALKNLYSWFTFTRRPRRYRRLIRLCYKLYIYNYNYIYIWLLYICLSSYMSIIWFGQMMVNQPATLGYAGVISWGTLSAFLSLWGTWKAPAAIGFPAHRLTARCCRWCYRSGSLSHSDLPTYTMDNPSQKDHYMGSLASRVWSKAQRLGFETKTTSNRTRAKYGKQSFGKISRIESPVISLYKFLSWKHGGKEDHGHLPLPGFKQFQREHLN